MTGTGAATSSTPSSSAQVLSNEAPSAKDAVGPDNVGGYSHVIELATYLHKLSKKDTKVINNLEAQEIIRLWEKLEAYDKSPTTFRERFHQQLVKGRFKAPKAHRTEAVPGQQSVRRCSLAPHLGPATWPDSNRYQEALLTQLCLANPSDTSKDGQRQARWRIVLTQYLSIQAMVSACHAVKENTKLQLPDINQRTLIAWFSARGKARERETLHMGLPLQGAPTVAPRPLPAALEKQPSLQKSADVMQLTFHENKTGKVTKGRRRLLPALPSATPPLHISATPSSSIPLPVAVVPRVPYSTTCSRKRREKMELEGVVKRKYVKSASEKKCTKCLIDISTQGHRQYYGNIYCPATSDCSYELWKNNCSQRDTGRRKLTKLRNIKTSDI